MEEKTITAKDIDLDYIQAFCIEHKHTAWYNEQLEKVYPQTIYPRVEKEVDGKIKKVLDKSQAPTIEMKPITYVQLKANFLEKFYPELIKDKKSNKVSKMFTRL